MFNLKKYKKMAVNQLKGNWGFPVALYFIALAAVFVFDFICIAIETILALIMNFCLNSVFINSFKIIGIILIIFLFILSIAFTLTTLVGTYSISYGFLKLSYNSEKVTFGDYFKGFTKFGRALRVTLWCNLWIFLWALIPASLILLMTYINKIWLLPLTIISYAPMMIKFYEYSQIIFLAVENNDLNARESMNLSKIITKGFKLKLFLSDLSFIGWSILSIFSLGIGFAWVLPYLMMTRTNIYHSILEQAIENGVIPENLLSKLKKIEESKPKLIEYTEKLPAPENTVNEENITTDTNENDNND